MALSRREALHDIHHRCPKEHFEEQKKNYRQYMVDRALERDREEERFRQYRRLLYQIDDLPLELKLEITSRLLAEYRILLLRALRLDTPRTKETVAHLVLKYHFTESYELLRLGRQHHTAITGERNTFEELTYAKKLQCVHQLVRITTAIMPRPPNGLDHATAITLEDSLHHWHRKELMLGHGFLLALPVAERKRFYLLIALLSGAPRRFQNPYLESTERSWHLQHSNDPSIDSQAFTWYFLRSLPTSVHAFLDSCISRMAKRLEATIVGPPCESSRRCYFHRDRAHQRGVGATTFLARQTVVMHVVNRITLFLDTVSVLRSHHRENKPLLSFLESRWALHHVKCTTKPGQVARDYDLDSSAHWVLGDAGDRKAAEIYQGPDLAEWDLHALILAAGRAAERGREVRVGEWEEVRRLMEMPGQQRVTFSWRDYWSWWEWEEELGLQRLFGDEMVEREEDEEGEGVERRDWLGRAWMGMEGYLGAVRTIECFE